MWWLAPALGIIGSLFKGKKTQMAPQQTPQQLALVQYLSQMAKGQMGQGAANKQPTYDALNMISRMFGVGGGNYGQPAPTAPSVQSLRDRASQGWRYPRA